MSRKQTIIIFPHLVNGDGSLDRAWYVEWKYRIPGDADQKKGRHYKGLNIGTREERTKIANKVIQEKTEWLKSGAYLNGDITKVYADELLYRNEAKIHGKYRESVTTFRTYLSAFLEIKKESLKNPKSYMDFQSKLRLFNAWLEKERLNDLNIRNINREHIKQFAMHLSKEGLSRATIEKYIQCVHAFFENEVENKRIDFNPATNIPKMGKVVDCAAVPIHKSDREKLKEVISKSDPQLWLACEIQYYCAIRPGTELRLMKIQWIDFEKKNFRIPNIEAKNSTVEIVVIPDFLIAEMKRMHLDDYYHSLYIFGKNGCPGTEPLGKNTMRNRFNRYRDFLGISKEYKFYSWKHTGAIQLSENGVKAYDLQTHLRHKSYTTTEVYLRKRIPRNDSSVNQFTSEI